MGRDAARVGDYGRSQALGHLYILYALLFLAVAGSEAMIIRIQLMYPHNSFVSPQVFNRIFTMHGTTMVFFVGIPVLFGLANYLRAVDDRRSRHGLSTPECLQFLADGVRGISSLLQFPWRKRAVRRRKCTRCGLVGYAPLTSRAFSPGHSSDYWTISLLVAGFRQYRHSDQHNSNDSLHALPGHEAEPMPLLVWLNLVVSGLVLIAITPLSAAQIMLCVDRYLGGHFLTPKPEGPQRYGCTSSGFSDIRKCTS